MSEDLGSDLASRSRTKRKIEFSTGGFILVSDYVRMEVTLVGASFLHSSFQRVAVTTTLLHLRSAVELIIRAGEATTSAVEV